MHPLAPMLGLYFYGMRLAGVMKVGAVQQVRPGTYIAVRVKWRRHFSKTVRAGIKSAIVVTNFFLYFCIMRPLGFEILRNETCRHYDS